ncbi:hypothetical protein SKAU_G00101990 [Synaphobranchus kaupii]|uniref:Uncharacterized protein n=1 Tax=Synaphobranchus kaupii TaxID=118154 RepID=A0A9Q1J7H9_SYNKA|nr:hypothetical protein SKAU_G00101990 [Synaphobranchus kaupii]
MKIDPTGTGAGAGIPGTLTAVLPLDPPSPAATRPVTGNTDNLLNEYLKVIVTTGKQNSTATVLGRLFHDI